MQEACSSESFQASPRGRSQVNHTSASRQEDQPLGREARVEVDVDPGLPAILICWLLTSLLGSDLFFTNLLSTQRV